ncbi:MAG: hypothetical protein HRU32_09415 [Rhodobacteraceae bacterium]|nr:hypothetical protein [Paracoccaceae bacterium]
MRLIALALAVFPAISFAEVARVPYDPLVEELDTLIDFENYTKFLSPGLRLDDVQSFKGAAFGERFAGQTTVMDNGFDIVQGRPMAPLTLVPGVAGQNLAVTFYFMLSNHLVGHAAPGYPENRAGGEGAISIMFDNDQYAIGFRVASEPEPSEPMAKGEMTVRFFRRDGSEIATLPVTLDWGRKGYGFRRSGDTTDITGVSITNRDPAGIGIDDLIFNGLTVTGFLTPEIAAPCADGPRSIPAIHVC